MNEPLDGSPGKPVRGHGLNLFISHDPDSMASRLVETIGRGAAQAVDPFIPEIILVQSKGMQRWLSMRIADTLGICCNVSFPFPNPFLYGSMIRKLSGGKEEWNFPYDRESMGWALLDIMSGAIAEPWAAPLRRYTGDPPSPTGLFQLSMQVAKVFDGYLMFRPEMILQWDGGGTTDTPDDAWQAELWRRLTSSLGGTHRAAAVNAFIDRISALGSSPPDFPSRISFFGVTALPELHLRAFEAASRFIETDVYLCLMTSRPGEFWEVLGIDPDSRQGGGGNPHGAWHGPFSPGQGSLMEPVSAARDSSVEVFPYQPSLPGFSSSPPKRKTSGKAGRGVSMRLDFPASPDSVPSVHSGNPLYDSMGCLGTEFAIALARLAKSSSGMKVSHMLDRPTASTVLQLVQGDIHTGIRRGTTPGYPVLPIDPIDRSIRVHSCHGPMREVEALRESLLGMFEEDPGLSPAEVVVMAPDISTYAPFVTAVFTATGSGPDIPFSIADIVQEGGPSAAFLDLLSVASGRLKATEVTGLLEHEFVRSRFGLGEHDLGRISRWVDEARIRWGADRTHLESLGLPPDDANTWRAGLDRLALSVALPGGEGRVWNGCAPHSGFEGEDALVLGRFIDFAKTVLRIRGELTGCRSVAEWADLLLGFWREAIEPGTGPRSREVERALAAFGAGDSIRGCTVPVPAEVAVGHLGSMLGEETQGLGYLSGRVTFCSLKPMRGIPFRVVWLLGMDSGGFPGRDSQPGFDMAARSPRPGDRSKRGDDKYLFLEAFMAARERFCVSFAGQSREEPSDCPPSVLVSELLDYLDEAFFVRPAPEKDASGHSGCGKPSDTVTVRHPMQPFSPRYFSGSDPELFSFSRENHLASLGVGKPVRPEAGLFRGPVEVKAPEEISLEDLAEFFVNPSRQILRQALGVELRSPGAGLQDEEPFLVMDGLERYGFLQGLTESLIRGDAPENFHRWASAAGMLPQGPQGDVAWDELVSTARSLAERVKEVSGSGPGRILKVDLLASGMRLSGRIKVEASDTAVVYRPSRVGPKDMVRGWVQHLAMLVSEGGGNFRTVLLGTADGSLGFMEFGALENPSALLDSLIGLYRMGLSEPLPFFPASSKAYADKAFKGAGHDEAFKAAAGVWRPSSSYYGPSPESIDPSFSACFPSGLPDTPVFRDAALEFWCPVLSLKPSKGMKSDRGETETPDTAMKGEEHR